MLRRQGDDSKSSVKGGIDCIKVQKGRLRRYEDLSLGSEIGAWQQKQNMNKCKAKFRLFHIISTKSSDQMCNKNFIYYSTNFSWSAYWPGPEEMGLMWETVALMLWRRGWFSENAFFMLVYTTHSWKCVLHIHTHFYLRVSHGINACRTVLNILFYIYSANSYRYANICENVWIYRIITV